eukprot:TRINITY_DN1332_c0_g1_i3.p1 TRINITY_DN1332_c0_g1~~TRINITY_DN1332_c0_g1_i3.p1  ORF type:complete len:328 (+),score=57.43 TRINITY_DN1332_c0_g1_i3:145-984(+)
MENIFLYPLSRFSVHKNLKSAPKCINFPKNLFVSNNYYKATWSLTGHHRIKNVIITMDWVPNPDNLKPDSEVKTISPEQVTRLQRVFEFFDVTQTNYLDIDELKELLQALDVDIKDAAEMKEYFDLIDTNKNDRVEFDEIKSMMTRSKFAKPQLGRHYVALSLAEAESLRGVIHLTRRQQFIEGKPCSIALNAGSLLIDSSYKHCAPGSYQFVKAQQAMRFLDSEMYYQEKELNLTLRSLQKNPIQSRLEWFEEVRSCRRRILRKWQETPIQKDIHYER